MTHIIGIDTGGTFTDAVVYDSAAHTVIAKAKALTTKGDFAVGVIEAMEKALALAGGAVEAGRVHLVSVSTTLATNAIVEGHGAAIAMVFVGFDDGMIARSGIANALPGTPIGRIGGGHDHAGEERFALDEAALEAFVREAAPKVEAFAVAAHYSVRNHSHESRVRDLILTWTGKPVTVSHELASALDAPRRALTAALNARLVSRITLLIEAIRRAMATLAIDAPLMIVKGDGTMASADEIQLRPIETILSGPAASVIGAKVQSGLKDFVMSDIGGTTTDIAILANGWPKLGLDGAEVGGWRTMVRAVEMRTYGLGGDSEVDIDDRGRVKLAANRIVPISLLATRHPEVIAAMARALADTDSGAYAGQFALRPFGRGAGATDRKATEREMKLLDAVGDRPVPLASLVTAPDARRALDRLVKAGILHVAGFTPSDAAHIRGEQHIWSREAAVLGARLLLKYRRMGRVASDDDVLAFAGTVFDALVARSGRAIIETLIDRPPNAADPLIDAVVGGSGAFRGIRVALGPSVPIVPVGAPARLYYPEIGRRLGAEIVFIDDGDVANAVGAAAGVVRGRAVTEVTSRPMGGYRVHHAAGLTDFATGAEALAEAARLAEAEARATAARMGAHALAAELYLSRVDLPDAKGDSGLISAIVTAESWGTAAD